MRIRRMRRRRLGRRRIRKINKMERKNDRAFLNKAKAAGEAVTDLY